MLTLYTDQELSFVPIVIHYSGSLSSFREKKRSRIATSSSKIMAVMGLVGTKSN